MNFFLILVIPIIRIGLRRQRFISPGRAGRHNPLGIEFTVVNTDLEIPPAAVLGRRPVLYHWASKTGGCVWRRGGWLL